MCYYEAKQTINDIFYLQKGKKMKQNRVEAVLKNMESLNLSQILITDHVHSHIVFNSVSFVDGKKYRYEKGDWAKYIQPITNKLCQARV